MPLAKSMHDVQIRLGEMDDEDVQVHAVSLPPFLFCSTADDESLVSQAVQIRLRQFDMVTAASDRGIPTIYPLALAEQETHIDNAHAWAGVLEQPSRTDQRIGRFSLHG